MTDVNELFTNHAAGRNPESNAVIESLIPAIDAAVRVSGLSAFIIDFDSHELLYQSDQMLYFDEASIKDIKRKCANPYWSLITEETLEQLAVLHKSYPAAYELMSTEEFEKHTCVLDYPINMRNNQMYITQKFTPLQMREDGITKVGLFTISHSNRETIDCNLITSSGRRFRFDFSDAKFIEYDLSHTLSITERAVLHRAKMGMSSETIAQNLHLSVNTVKTHKKNIFKKLKVNTVTEALIVVGNYHLI